MFQFERSMVTYKACLSYFLLEGIWEWWIKFGSFVHMTPASLLWVCLPNSLLNACYQQMGLLQSKLSKESLISCWSYMWFTVCSGWRIGYGKCALCVWSNFFSLKRLSALVHLINTACSNLMPCCKDGVFVLLFIVVCIGVISWLFTLMSAVTIICCFSWLLITSFVIWFVLSNVASCSSPFLVDSPICSIEEILDGGQVRRVIMSDTAWVQKLSVVMAGIGIVCGMKTSVSVTKSILVDGMKHVMDL